MESLMPTYEYECHACRQRVEAVQKFADPALTVCPLCGGELRKVFSSVGIVFKGSGFYKNDSRSTTSTATSATSTSDAASAPAPAATAAAAPSAGSGESATTPDDLVGLGARERDLVNRNCLAGRRTGQPLDVAADVGNAEQHALQRRGDRRLANRLGQRPVANHEPGESHREVSRHRIHARVHAHDRFDVDTVLDALDDRRRVDVTRCQLQCPTAR